MFFETEEQEVVQGGSGRTVATFSTLGKCWKVTFDLKPLVLEENTPWVNVQTRIDANGREYCRVVLTSTGSSATLISGENGMSANHQLRIGEWNRIEITHEKGEGGNFFITLSVGEEELVKLDVGILEQEKFLDVQLLLGSPGHHSSVFTRRILVIEKS